ncbi:MAG: hypothetical protein JJT82_08965 [Legionellaceae bacterium]|nr:hypothetical protein [Legionellaceae bacterium]
MDKERALIDDWLQTVARSLAKNEEPPVDFYQLWIDKPARVLLLIDRIDQYPDQELDTLEHEFSAAIIALDICVANLQSALENGQKSARGMLDRIMETLTEKMLEKKHGLPFWMPILNAFYDVQVELSQPLKNAYLWLADQSESEETAPEDTLDNIREMIQELSHHNIYEIAEHIFAQSHVMPPEFFAELLLDLFSLDEGQDIGLLSLMHPHPVIRASVLEVLNDILPQVRLSPASLSRLQAIRHWYFDGERRLIEGWIKQQRKQGVVFARPPVARNIRIRACEIDGSGTQGIILRMSHQRKPIMAGLLFKGACGIKDIWLNTLASQAVLEQQFKELFNEDLYSREVDLAYFTQLTNHFLQETLAMGSMPDLQLLQLQEVLGIQFIPQKIDIKALLASLTVLIQPFTPELITQALQSSKKWSYKAPFAGSWFAESPVIDSVVNQCCTYKEGTKICDLTEAITQVIHQVFDAQREKWCFHFLWNALWLKAKARPQERSWRDSLLIAYVIDQGMALADIPVMQTIAQQTVINSMETMNNRRTHLNTLST